MTLTLTLTLPLTEPSPYPGTRAKDLKEKYIMRNNEEQRAKPNAGASKMPGREAAAGKTAEARRSAEGLLRVLEGPAADRGVRKEPPPAAASSSGKPNPNPSLITNPDPNPNPNTNPNPNPYPYPNPNGRRDIRGF